MVKLREYAIRRLRERNRYWCCLASVFSVLYGGIIRLRNRCYECGFFGIRKVGCPVISIGNITTGGTGKTPVVVMLANLFRERGYTPAVLTRGYGGKTKSSVGIVSDGRNILMNFAQAGDEPILIARYAKGIPVIRGSKRFITGAYAVDKFDTNLLILDDAFQHRSLYRDIDIVLVDEKRPFGNGCIVPRGELREPAHALDRADVIVMTGTDGDVGDPTETRGLLEQFSSIPLFRAIRRPKDIIECETGSRLPLAYLAGKSVCAFAGIAAPKGFRASLKPLCGRLAVFLPFPDHHVYTEKDMTRIVAASSAASADVIITTEKDGIKIENFPEFYKHVYLLRIGVEITPSVDAFLEVLTAKVR